MTHSQPTITVVILNVIEINMLVECLRSLNKTQYAKLGIIVVHNGPPVTDYENTVRFASERVSDIIFTGYNSGFSSGNNAGIQLALGRGADYILLLNDDTVVSPSFLDLLLQTAEKIPDAGMLGPKIYHFLEPRKIWFAGARFDPRTCTMTTPGSDQFDEGMDSEPLESDYITGCTLLIKRRAVERIGLLDERFFLYWEDVDWGLRAKKSGLKNIMVPHSHVWHKVSASSGGMDSPLRIYHKTRSHLLLARLHAPESLNRLHMRFFRDIAWLLIKSSGPHRAGKAMSYLAAIRDYHLGKTGRGPDWIWVDQ